MSLDRLSTKCVVFLRFLGGWLGAFGNVGDRSLPLRLFGPGVGALPHRS